MHVPALLAIVVAFHSPELIATGEISPELAGDPNRWLRQRAAFIAAHASKDSRLPIVYRLDRDFVTAARTRGSIHVVDDCNDRELCGVATNELEREWDKADLHAIGGQAPSPVVSRTGGAPVLHGATLAVVNRLESHLIATPSRDEIHRLRKIGYDAVTLVPYGGQRGFGGVEIHRYDTHPAGETDLSMSLAAARAHAVSMQVMLKPQLWTEGEHGGDSTRIEPRDWKQWFDSYQVFLMHHARLAEEIGAEWLCVGTELTRTESHADDWRRLIAAVRAIYHGRIVYAANFDAFERTPFWDAVDAIGIDAYFPLSDDPRASDRALRDGAREVVAHVDAVAAKWHKLVIFTELGYPSTTAPWVTPWREDRSASAAPADQARAFAAMLDAIGKSRSISGFIIWKYASDPLQKDERGYLPKDKPAERVIECYLH